jgi:formylglycine-generating enzyme required for sulfatase activity
MRSRKGYVVNDSELKELCFQCSVCDNKILLVQYGSLPLKCPKCGTDLQSKLKDKKPVIPRLGEKASSLDGSEMVFVPKGPFIMGSNLRDIEKAYNSAKSKYSDVLWVWFERELPHHEMNIPGFWIDVVPVTCAQYDRFCSMTGYTKPKYWLNGKIPEGQAEFPVVEVSWEDAISYCLWAGKRLPYESEWEKASRGANGRIWPWGDQYRKGCGNIDNIAQGIQPVGSYPDGASPYGCLDMAGNVFEWTKDICVPYPGYLETDELRRIRAKMSSNDFERITVFGDGVSSKEVKPFQFFNTVARGGAYGSCAEFCRSAFRLDFNHSGSNSLGFRCVLGEETYYKMPNLGKEGRYDEVLQLVEAALILSPNYPTALHNACTALGGLGRPNQAIPIYQKLVALWPTDHDSWNQLGIFQFKVGETLAAINSYDAALSHDPSKIDYWFNKGLAVYKLTKSVPMSNLVGLAMIAAESAGCFELAQRLGADDDQLKSCLGTSNRQEEAVVKYMQSILDQNEFARLQGQLGFARSFPLIQLIWLVINKYYPDRDFTYSDLNTRGFTATDVSTGLTYLKDWDCVEGVALRTFHVKSKDDISTYEPWRIMLHLQ